jgi:hypothetical protein
MTLTKDSILLTEKKAKNNMGWIWRSSWGHLKYSTLLEGAIWSASEPSSIKLDAWCIRTSTLAATWQWWIRLLGQRSLSISCNHFEPLSCNNLTMQLRHARSTISVVSIEKKTNGDFFFGNSYGDFWEHISRHFSGVYGYPIALIPIRLSLIMWWVGPFWIQQHPHCESIKSWSW